MRLAAVVVTLAPALAVARPWHGTVSGGSSLALTASDGDRLRFDVGLDLKPRSRYGLTLGWRQFDADRRGLLVAGLLYEAGAARPRLVIDFHASVGIDLDDPTPLVGAGMRTTLGLVGPLAIVLDVTPYVVLRGWRDSFQLTTSAALAVSF